MAEVSSRIREWIAQEVVYEGPNTFTEKTPLLGGVIDSMSIVALLLFIQDEFQVEIEDADVTIDHFRDLSAIERFVTEKIQNRSQKEAARGD